MTSPFCVDQVLDVDFTRQDASALFEVGKVVKDNLGGEWMYVKAEEALTVGLCYKILPTGDVGSGTASEDAVDDNAASFVGGFPCCWPQAAFTADTWGWVQLSSGSGTLEARVLNGVNAGTKLYTGQTAGVLEGTASGHYKVLGEAISVDAGHASALVTIQVPTRASIEATVGA